MLCGPSLLLPDTVLTILLGLTFLGLFNALFLLPIFTLIQEQMRKEFSPQSAQGLSDASAGLLQMSISLGVMIAPFWAQWSQGALGFRLTNDVCAGVSLFIMFMYLTYGKAYQDIFKS